MPEIVIIGAGGFGREVADVVEAINASEATWNIAGFVDDRPNPLTAERLSERGQPVVGPISELARFSSSTYAVIAIGSPQARREIQERPEVRRLPPATLVHPSANVASSCRLGTGVVVCGHADIGADVVIGDFVHIDRSVQVGHDSLIAAFATVHPSAVISGACRVGNQAEIGTNATLLPGVDVGLGARIGAAACVVNDVAAGVTVKGIPAR